MRVLFNVFAAPGGLIFVTKGILRCSRDEGDLAAILAHEIGHVQRKHGLKAIKQARLTTALVTIGKTAADATMPKSDLAELTDLFEDSILNITKTLVDSGYSKGQEREADKDGVEILRRTRYASRSLVDVLEIMETRLKPGGLDFAKTHPDPKARIRYIERWIKNDPAPGKPPAVRQRRYSIFTAATL